jgi:hypothetical protein
MGCPTTGADVVLVIDVVVASFATDTPVPVAVVEARKLPSLTYPAVNVKLPAVTSVIVQLPMPAVSGAAHVCVPSCTVTDPVGVPFPGKTAATVTETTMGSPTTGFDVVPVIEVVVPASPTVTLVVAAVEEDK